MLSFIEYLKEDLNWKYSQDEESIKEEPVVLKAEIQVTGQLKSTKDSKGLILCGQDCQYLLNKKCNLFEKELKQDNEVDLLQRTELCFNIK